MSDPIRVGHRVEWPVGSPSKRQQGKVVDIEKGYAKVAHKVKSDGEWINVLTIVSLHIVRRVCLN